MSHNLMINANGNAALAYNQNTGLPWHHLGVPVNGAMTWREAMEIAGLNWTISKRQLFSQEPGKDTYLPVEYWGMFRDDNDTFLGAVGGQYTAIQNEQAFDFVDTLLEAQEGAHYDTAGALFNGERIFVSATIPYSISPDRAPDDRTDCYLMFETSHDGTMSATAKLSTVRVVCNNTLSAALNQQGFGTLKIRHSQAKKLFQGVQQSVESLKEKFNTLSGRKINKEASREIMDKLFGKDWSDSTQKRNQVERIAAIFDDNDNNAFPEIKGSAYNLIQAITNWSDHERTVRKTERMNSMDMPAVRAQAAVFNGADSFKTSALETILSLTENCSPMPEPAMHFQSAAIHQGSKPVIEEHKKPIDSILDMVSM